MFEQAIKMKLRFESSKGLLSCEQLWDLPLTDNQVSLDSMAIELNKQVKEKSFVHKKSHKDEVNELRFDIVKFIINAKLKEIDDNTKAIETKAKKEQILGIIADKQEDKLKDKSISKLKAMIDSL